MEEVFVIHMQHVGILTLRPACFHNTRNYWNICYRFLHDFVTMAELHAKAFHIPAGKASRELWIAGALSAALHPMCSEHTPEHPTGHSHATREWGASSHTTEWPPGGVPAASEPALAAFLTCSSTAPAWARPITTSLDTITASSLVPLTVYLSCISQLAAWGRDLASFSINNT